MRQVGRLRRINGPYFQDKIEEVPFESRQEGKVTDSAEM